MASESSLRAAPAPRLGLGLAAGLGAGALWGLVFLAPRMAPQLGAVDLTAARFLVYGAAAGLALLSRGASVRWPNAREAAVVLGLSVLGATGYYALLAQAVRWAGVDVPTLIIGSIPLWVMLADPPRTLRWARWALGVGLTLTGLGVMTWQGLRAWPSTQPAIAASSPVHAVAAGVLAGIGWPAPLAAWGGAFGAGMGLAALAMLSWTAFAVLNAAWLKRHPDLGALQWANWLGLASALGALLLWALWGSPLAELAQLRLDALAWFAIVGTGLGSAWLASVLWNLASRHLSVGLCGQLIVSETLFSLLYAALWDGLWPNRWQVLAAGLFVAGILASLRAHVAAQA